MTEATTFSPIRMTAATEDAAVAQALQIVGAARENVSVEVLSQDAKGTTVRVSPRKEEDDSANATSTDATQSSTRSAEAAPSETYLSSGDSQVVDAMNASVPIEKEDRSRTELQAVESLQDVLPTLPADLPPIETVAEAAEALAESAPLPEADDASKERACALAQQMLERMGMEAQAQIESAPSGSSRQESNRNNSNRSDSNRADVPRIFLQIDGEDVGILIGKHGQTLQAFQYLLNVTLNNNGEEDGARFRVSIDAGGYRARRGEALQQMALEAAERAKRDRRSVRLEPMPAHERRLVHMALQNDGTISTDSEGREPLRHVVVIPAGARPLSSSNDRGNDRNARSASRPNGSFGGGNSGGGNRGYRGSR